MVTFEDVLEIPDINEVSSAIHKSSRSHISLDEQFKTVVSSGHPWCAFVRDNWSCHGSFYQSVLNDTKLFDRNFTSRLLLQFGKCQAGFAHLCGG
jgi:hypothetical protein